MRGRRSMLAITVLLAACADGKGDTAGSTAGSGAGSEPTAGSTSGATTGTPSGSTTGSGAPTGTPGTAVCDAVVWDPALVNCHGEWTYTTAGYPTQPYYEADYDACGRYARFEVKFGGVSSLVQTWTYDAQGLLVWFNDDAGTPPDGVPDVERFHTYDGTGRLELVEWFEGAVTPRCTQDHQHLDADAWVDVIEDRCSGFVATNTWQADGDPLTIEHDLDLDGVTDEMWTYTYDAYDQTATQRMGPPGGPWVRSDYLWSGGRLVGLEIDLEDDGVLESTAVYGYDAGGRLNLIESTYLPTGQVTTMAGTFTCGVP